MSTADATTLIINDVPQYFFDNTVLDQIQDITRTVHSPGKSPQPLIQQDRPWECLPFLTVNGWTILRDSKTGKFHCWYDDFPVDTQKVVQQKTLYCVTDSWTGYACSDDGIHWDKPALDYLAVDGKSTNIVLGGNGTFHKLDATTVFEDTLEVDPAKRFKMMLTRYIHAGDRTKTELSATLNLKPGFDTSNDEIRIELHHSPDGIHWTPDENLPRYGRHGNGLGDCYTFFLDEETGIYRFLTRAAGMGSVHYDARRPRTISFFEPHFPDDPARMNKRRVFLSQSTDLIHWSRPESIITPDSLDNLDDSYYGMVQFRIGEMYVGLLNILHEVPNTMDVRLLYSRDGWHWHDANNRQPWLTTSADAWDSSMVNISSPPVAVDDELRVYYGGASNHHDWWITGLYENLDTPEARDINEVRWGIGLATLRRDGFISLDAGPVREGIIITRALMTDRQTLELNAACHPGGAIAVEVTDADENVIQGFSRSDCDLFIGDSTSTTITWHGKADIPHGASFRLRFFMHRASLYSFRLA